jgi:transposase, IS5 family
MKIMRRWGADTVEGLHDQLIAKAVDEHNVKVEVVRGDTTVVEADVTYPTDSGLLAKAVRRMVVLVRRIQAAGGARRTRVRDRTRAASRRARSIAANLKRRTGEAKQTVTRITGELADLAVKMAADANRALTNARRMQAAGRDGAATTGGV